MVYSREIDGKTLTFGVSGKLLKNALIMFDYETKSLWPVMMNQAIRGEMAGTKLEQLPIVEKTTWGIWKAAHPETRVLSVRGREYIPLNVYAKRFADGKVGARPIENEDSRLPPFERIVALAIQGADRAYPVERLRASSVIQEEVGEVPVVLAIAASSGSLGVFDRRVGDDVLRFKAALNEERLEDEEGTLWELSSGRAIEGPRKGQQLERLGTRDVFWFIWADYHPKTTIFGGPSKEKGGWTGKEWGPRGE